MLTAQEFCEEFASQRKRDDKEDARDTLLWAYKHDKTWTESCLRGNFYPGNGSKR